MTHVTTYTLEDRQRVQADLNLDTLPDDEFMELAAQVRAAATPRPAGDRVVATAPDELEGTIQRATAGELLAEAKARRPRSNAAIGATLGVSRQRVAEILESRNLELQTIVRVAASLGYETRLMLHPVDGVGPDLAAVLPAEASAL